MKYKKGDILDYEFPKQFKNTNGLFDSHRAIVLHTRSTPYHMVLIAPITSLTSLKKWSDIPENYLELKCDDYLGILQHDSYANLDMIVSVDEKKLKVYENNKGVKIVSKLNDDDLYNLDVKLVLTYELKKYIKSEINSEVLSIVDYIDNTIKDRVKEILNQINDKEIQEKLLYIIENDIVKEIKTQYF